MVDTFNRLSDPLCESVSRHDTYRIPLLPLSVPLCHLRGEHAHSQESRLCFRFNFQWILPRGSASFPPTVALIGLYAQTLARHHVAKVPSSIRIGS